MGYNKHINEFEKEYQKTENKRFLVENEIKEVESFLDTDIFKIARKSRLMGYSHKLNRVFRVKYTSNDVFKSFFHGIQLNSNFELPKDCQNVEYYENVFKDVLELSSYYDYLKDLIKKPKQAKSTLSHKQKMLALHYLGLDLSKHEKKSIAVILSQILDLDYENTRKYLTYYSGGKNDVRTKSNLEKMYEIFKNQGFTDISNTIKEDLKSYDK